jgi:hypothetical protein
MKYKSIILLITIFFIASVGHSQTKEESIQYLNLLFNKMNFTIFSNSTDSSGYKNTYRDYDRELIFFKEFMIIHESNYTSHYFLKNIKSNDYIIQIKDIISIIIEKNEYGKPILNISTNIGMYHFQNQPIHFIYKFVELKDKNNWGSITDSKTLAYGLPKEEEFQFNNFDNQINIKFIKTLKHLVKLCGGKVLDDLF